MKNVKALKSFKGDSGFFYKGHVQEVTNDYADQLVTKGLAEIIKDKKELKEDIVEIKVDAPEETKEIKEVKKKK